MSCPWREAGVWTPRFSFLKALYLSRRCEASSQIIEDSDAVSSMIGTRLPESSASLVHIVAFTSCLATDPTVVG
jgi:hypothetical protein